MKNIGLVLEGGGTRGVYSTGVLDAFLEYGIEVTYVIGVSIGAYNGAAYIAKQKKRNYKVYTEYINDDRLINFKRLIKGESILNFRFVFEFINRDKYLFNYDNFFNSKNTFISVSTDCIIGKPVYFEKDKYEKTDVDEIIRSSQNINASMIEHDIDKLNKYYEIGWLQGIDEIQKIKYFLED